MQSYSFNLKNVQKEQNKTIIKTFSLIIILVFRIRNLNQNF